MYYTWTINGKELKLKLTTSTMIALEDKLGYSPLDVFMNVQNGQLPTVKILALILHASLQKFQHNFTLQEVYNLLDEYFESGETVIDLIPVILEVFKVSGFFKVAE